MHVVAKGSLVYAISGEYGSKLPDIHVIFQRKYNEERQIVYGGGDL